MITFTKAERNAIALAWVHIDSHAMPSGFRARMNDAVSIERRAFHSERTTLTQARAQVIAWFHDGYQTPVMYARCLAGVRIACMVATLSGIEARSEYFPKHSLSVEGVAAIAAASGAYQAAIDRARGA